MNLKTEETYTLKLNSGEEIISKVKEVEIDGWVILSEPVTVAPGQQGMGLIPTMFTADPNGFYRLNTNSIMIYAVTEDSIKRKYLEVVTGLVMPDKKMILG